MTIGSNKLANLTPLSVQIFVFLLFFYHSLVFLLDHMVWLSQAGNWFAVYSGALSALFLVELSLFSNLTSSGSSIHLAENQSGLFEDLAIMFVIVREEADLSSQHQRCRSSGEDVSRKGEWMSCKHATNRCSCSRVVTTVLVWLRAAAVTNVVTWSWATTLSRIYLFGSI